MGNINFLAVIVAAASSFLLGGLWYARPVFGKAWTEDAGVAEQQGHPARVFGLSFVFSLVAATAFAYLLGAEPEFDRALKFGLIVGACFVAASFGINYQFANRPFRMLAIDGGYHIAQFILFGLVLGLWP